MKRTPKQIKRRSVLRKVLYDNNPEKYRKESREWFIKNRTRSLEMNRLWRRNMRLKILNHYSDGKLECVCCKEKILEFLTLDHINNDGTKLRKMYSNGGHQHYRRIIKQGFPKGFQVLCYNCNCGRAKTKDKICPHEKK